jgi:hypothetical protein
VISIRIEDVPRIIKEAVLDLRHADEQTVLALQARDILGRLRRIYHQYRNNPGLKQICLHLARDLENCRDMLEQERMDVLGRRTVGIWLRDLPEVQDILDQLEGTPEYDQIVQIIEGN